MAGPAQQPENDGRTFWGVLAAIVGFLVLVSYCSGDNAQMNVADILNETNAEMGNDIAAQKPAPVEALSEGGVRRGIAHLRLAVGAEGFSGAMVYSQNCYDALSREFTWARLDQCGGADMIAVRSIESAGSDEPGSEAAYFQSEAAAGRYLAAATSAGQPAAEADQRLSQLQAEAAGARKVAPRAPAAAEDIMENLADSDESEEDSELVANVAEEALSGE